MDVGQHRPNRPFLRLVRHEVDGGLAGCLSAVSYDGRFGFIGLEREVIKGLFIGGDYVYQHWTNLDRSVDLNAPSLFVRTAPGQTRSAAQGSPPIGSAESPGNRLGATPYCG